MKKNILTSIIKIDKLLDRQWPLFVALVLLVLLRVPNLVEPYWYGDEGIYLTLGQSMNKGVLLYEEIIDHKTPIIYFLAQTHTQLNFRLLLIGWMLVTTTAFYYIAKTLFKDKLTPTFISTIVFVLATTLPAFEGNIPNGELFVMGFVLVGMLLLIKTEYVQQLLHPKAKTTSSPWYQYLLSGSFLSLGVLTKVPAVFDVAAVIGFGYFAITNAALTGKTTVAKVVEKLKTNTAIWFWLGVGLLLPILASIVYFVSKGAGQAYLDFGLLYNFRYAGSWQLPFSNPLLLFFFTLPGKVVATAVLTLVLTFGRKYISPAYQFMVFWFGLALFASLLSNRPYPHYYLQIAPALSLVLAGSLYEAFRALFTQAARTSRNILGPLLSFVSITLFVVIVLLIDVHPYPTVSYYRNFLELARGNISAQEYNQRFDVHMKDNYAAVEVMEQCPDDHLFIWGTNPMLYALADRIPTGRFTVSFHIKDFNAFDETYNDLVEDAPSFIVVMNSEDAEFPQFYDYLESEYSQTPVSFDHFTLWNRNDCTVGDSQ